MGTSDEGLLRVEKQTRNTVSLQRILHLFGNADTMVCCRPPSLFVNVLETILRFKKFTVPVFISTYGQNEEVGFPLFPTSNLSMIRSTVRREHST